MTPTRVGDHGFTDASARRAGDGTIVLSSASSKTPVGLAHRLARRADRPEVVGLTSAGNVAFIEGLGVYHRMVTYDDLASLPADPAVASCCRWTDG